MSVLVSTIDGAGQKFTFGKLRITGQVDCQTSVTIGAETISTTDSFPQRFEFKVPGCNRSQLETLHLYLGTDGRLCIICQWPCKVGNWMGFKTKTVYVSGWSQPLAEDEALTTETEPVFKSDTRELLEINGMIFGVLGAIGALAYIGYILFS